LQKPDIKAGTDLFIALDPASSEFYDKAKKKYILKSENKELKTSRYGCIL